MEEREAEAGTKEQIYREQMQALGIYEEIFEPEIRTLARVEREYTRAEKAWSATAAPGGKPSFLDPHYPVIQRLRTEILQHREALGLTPKALRKLTGGVGAGDIDQKDLITAKLDRIAERVSGYDVPGNIMVADPFAGIPEADEAAAMSDMMDQETRVAQDMYETTQEAAPAAKISHDIDEDLRHAVAEDMG